MRKMSREGLSAIPLTLDRDRGLGEAFSNTPWVCTEISTLHK